MRPALEPGDWALAVDSRRIRRGDVAVVEHPHRPGFEMVKRIVALPGDLAPDGTVLGPGRLWVRGDAADSSTDSRTFGPVSRDRVKARLVLVYWPPERRRRV